MATWRNLLAGLRIKRRGCEKPHIVAGGELGLGQVPDNLLRASPIGKGDSPYDMRDFHLLLPFRKDGGESRGGYWLEEDAVEAHAAGFALKLHVGRNNHNLQ